MFGQEQKTTVETLSKSKGCVLSLTEGIQCGGTTNENKYIIQKYKLLEEMIYHMGDQQKQQSRKLIHPITEYKRISNKDVLND